jgi:hypothetical protein
MRTLAWRSSGEACTAGGGWSGTKPRDGQETVGPLTQTTTFTLSCTNTNADPGNASVTVVASQAPAPAPTANKVWSEENLTSLDYVRLPYGIRRAVWDEARGLVYGVTSPDTPTAPNSLIAINPVTHATQTLPLGGQAWTLELTQNGEFIYVAMLGGLGVKRIRAADLTLDLDLPLGDSFAAVQRVVPSPVAPRTFAVLVNRMTSSTDDYGLYIFDDAVQRPQSLRGNLDVSPTEHYVNLAFIDVDWSADGTLLYAMGYGSTPGLFHVTVDAQGAHFLRRRGWPTASPGTLIGERWYSEDGRVFNMTGAVALHGWVPDEYFASSQPLPVPARGKIFSIGTNLDGVFEDGTRIMAFDFETLTYIDSAVFNGTANFRGGTVVPWGTDGFFITGQTESIIARGGFAAAGGLPPQSPAALPVAGAAVARNTSAGVISYRIVDMAARALATNPCGRMFVATHPGSWVRPGSVLEVNPDDLSVTRSASVGGEPWLLAASDDCNTLYAGTQWRTSVARLRTSDLATTDVLPLGDETLSLARSISVAPGQAQTVAISMSDGRSSCYGVDDGVVIFDGNTPRPVFLNESVYGIKSVAFGANAGVLYAGDAQNIAVFDASAAGLGNRRDLMTELHGSQHMHDLGKNIFYDPVANRVYNLFGHVYDAAAAAPLPRITLSDVAMITSCGMPAQTRVTDRTSGKLFWVAATSDPNLLGLSAYARNGLAQLGAIQFGLSELGRMGYPTDLSRLPGGRVAFITDRGFLVVVQGAVLGQ